MSLIIKTAALITSVQDAGRHGYLRFGLPHSGPMDWWAHRAANRLVGTDPGSACLEIGMTSCALQLATETLVAVCGAGYQVLHNQREVPLWMSFLVQPGDSITLEKTTGGNWVYLAVYGGIRSDAWLGSRSVYPRGNLGRYLQDGDELPAAACPPQARMMAGRGFPQGLRPAYSLEPMLRLIQGPERERFKPASRAAFYNQAYGLSPQSDRMGYRLVGTPLVHQDGADIVSRGMAMGELQVPGDGQPIVMMADHPTTGGYTSLGGIFKVDWPLLAQSQPGLAHIRFQEGDTAEARKSLIQTVQGIDSVQYDQEDSWLHL